MKMPALPPIAKKVVHKITRNGTFIGLALGACLTFGYAHERICPSAERVACAVASGAVWPLFWGGYYSIELFKQQGRVENVGRRK
jgi:hypothetical protein